MKTIGEWLELLPEPYRSQAIKNTHAERLYVRAKDMCEAINEDFIWAESPENNSYWHRLFLKYLHLKDRFQ